MAFNGEEGKEISLETASAWTENYRNANPGAVKAQFFGKDIIKAILDQEDCMGIRIYYGKDNDGGKTLILVGADSDENDMLDLIADFGTVCPNICGTSNDLNS